MTLSTISEVFEIRTGFALSSDNEIFCLMHLSMTENPNSACKHLKTFYALAPPNMNPPIFTSVMKLSYLSTTH